MTAVAAQTQLVKAPIMAMAALLRGREAPPVGKAGNHFDVRRLLGPKRLGLSLESSARPNVRSKRHEVQLPLKPALT